MHRRTICHADRCACGNTFHKNSTVVELSGGDLLAAWFAGEHGEGNRDQNIYGSRLPAGADEWTDAEPLVEVEGRALGCPVLFEGPGDDLWLTAPQMYGDWIVSSRLFYKRSSDGGRTWNDLELLHDRAGLYLKNKPLYLDSEDRYVLGTDILHGAENRPGFLLIPGDATDRPGDFPPLVGGDELLPDAREGLDRGQRLIYPTAVELDDGTLRAYLRPRPGGHLHAAESTDRGLTWSSAEPTAVPNPDAGFDVVRTDAGNLVLVVNPVEDTIPEGRNLLAVLLSEDEGETWPHRLVLEREAVDRPLREMDQVGRPEFTYGNVIQAADGTLHVTYESRRNAIEHVALTEDDVRAADDDISLGAS